MQYGTTPLIWACRKGYLDIVESLLAEGANADASGMVSVSSHVLSVKSRRVFCLYVFELALFIPFKYDCTAWQEMN